MYITRSVFFLFLLLFLFFCFCLLFVRSFFGYLLLLFVYLMFKSSHSLCCVNERRERAVFAVLHIRSLGLFLFSFYRILCAFSAFYPFFFTSVSSGFFSLLFRLNPNFCIYFFCLPLIFVH